MNHPAALPPVPSAKVSRLAFVLLALGFVLLVCGSYLGLFVAPTERFMGDVYRIMYVHVPTAWNAMLALTYAFIAALLYLFTGNWKWDARLEAAIEAGIVLSLLLCVQGAIWAKPTWGVWWDWDPRLTTTAVMLLAFVGVVALRNFVEDPEKRARWSAVATIISFVDVPIVYYSVQWWNSLHQMQSTPQTVSSPFHVPLRMNAFGILALMIGWIILRSQLATLRLRREMAAPVITPGIRIAFATGGEPLGEP